MVTVGLVVSTVAEPPAGALPAEPPPLPASIKPKEGTLSLPAASVAVTQMSAITAPSPKLVVMVYAPVTGSAGLLPMTVGVVEQFCFSFTLLAGSAVPVQVCVPEFRPVTVGGGGCGGGVLSTVASPPPNSEVLPSMSVCVAVTRRSPALMAPVSGPMLRADHPLPLAQPPSPSTTVDPRKK